MADRRSIQDRDLARGEARERFKNASDETLADALFRIADQPRRWGPDDTWALLYVAGARLRQRSVEAKGETFHKMTPDAVRLRLIEPDAT